jgi:hypothetical protein
MPNEEPTTTQCPACHGTGTRNGQVCNLCGGSGEASPGAIEEDALIAPPATAPSAPGEIRNWDHPDKE